MKRISTLFPLLLVFLTACDLGLGDALPRFEAPTIATFSASQNTVQAGQSTTLTWQVSGSSPITLTLSPEPGDVTGRSSVVVNPTETTTYVLTANNNRGTRTKEVEITVSGQTSEPEPEPTPGQQPQAADDTATTEEGSPVDVDVLANDTYYVDKSQVRLEITQAPQYGQASVGSDGEYTVYTPSSTYYAEDSYEYTYYYGEYSVTAKVTVSINKKGEEQKPQARNYSAMTKQGKPVNIDVLSNDTYYVPKSEIRIEITKAPQYGKAEVFNRYEYVTYTPSETYYPEDTFEYTFYYGNYSATARVKVVVNQKEEVKKPQAYDDKAETKQGELVNTDVLANDQYYVDKSEIRLEVTKAPQYGKAEVYNGYEYITYTPSSTYYAEDYYEYTFYYGEYSATARVTIKINRADENEEKKPQAYDDKAEVKEDESVKTDVLANDQYYVPKRQLRLEVTKQPRYGDVEVSDDYSYIEYEADDDYYGEDLYEYTFYYGNYSATASVFVTIKSEEDDD